MLGLYVHIPWCIKKCPYCDFNSHEIRNGMQEERYVSQLFEDLTNEVSTLSGEIRTVYFGGGTPSLFRPESFHKILSRNELSEVVEVTMEANPGTTEHLDFSEYAQAGINRLSLGVQSLNNHHLKTLGRIHNATEAKEAIDRALNSGFKNVNIDLMYGLPNQTIEEAVQDLQLAIDMQPQHISWYELTIEPNTVFGKRPPTLPPSDYRSDMAAYGLELLETNGYHRYEVSAYAKPKSQCLHNVNYWEFGDYIGIGAGAHGKHTDVSKVIRTVKVRMPSSYLDSAKSDSREVKREDLPSEFMLNALRLTAGVPETLFTDRTTLPIEEIQPTLNQLRDWGLMDSVRLKLTPLGYEQLNGVVQHFL